ncbi:hypothetical protein CDAR_98721 [Caerostris darwini]|uniref:Uncharacterized protein n=1 Tax=Caerostris darwini TaxID=1538125 RepID=A0AAV4Q512_9ARAC|nr:hypothetical protein CDAR_98721 [Caerostris darwini]
MLGFLSTFGHYASARNQGSGGFPKRRTIQAIYSRRFRRKSDHIVRSPMCCCGREPSEIERRNFTPGQSSTSPSVLPLRGSSLSSHRDRDVRRCLGGGAPADRQLVNVCRQAKEQSGGAIRNDSELDAETAPAACGLRSSAEDNSLGEGVQTIEEPYGEGTTGVVQGGKLFE